MTAPVLQIPVKVPRSATAGRRPGDGTFRALTDGEIFINTQDRVLCYLSASGTLLTVPLDPVFFAGLAPLASPAFTGTPTAPTQSAGDTSANLATTAYADRAAAARAPLAAYPSRCILTTTGASGTSACKLVLMPKEGNGVLVNGSVVIIPDAGITLAPTGLTANSLCWVYLTSAAALEASTTAPVVQAGTGLKIKGGASGATDPTRRLVGMAVVGSNGYFYNDPVYRYTRTYFNDPGVAGSAATSSDVSQTSNSGSVAISCIALMWAGEVAAVTASGRLSSNSANGSANLQAAVGGSAVGPYSGGQSYGAQAVFGAASAGNYTAASDGPVNFQALLSSDGTNTGRLLAGAQVAVATDGNGVS